MCIALDARELRALAPDAVIRRGLLTYRRRQVASIDADEDGLRACVLGAAPGEGFEVEIELVEGGVDCRCSCEESGRSASAAAARWS